MEQKLFYWNDKVQPELPSTWKGQVIWYKQHPSEEVATAQQDFFQRLIGNALKLPLEDFFLLDYNAGHFRFQQVHRQQAVRKCLLFGVSEQEAGLNMQLPMYRWARSGDTEFLKADAPEIISKDALLKKQLWEQLQHAFTF